jgi:hypothetical protein
LRRKWKVIFVAWKRQEVFGEFGEGGKKLTGKRNVLGKGNGRKGKKGKGVFEWGFRRENLY